MIRKAVVEDVDTITRLYNITIGSSRMAKIYVRKNVLSKQVYVYEKNNEVIGAYVIETSNYGNPYRMNKIPYTVYWLHQIMIFPEYQKKGYGSQMMEHYFKAGKDNNVDSFKLVCKDKLVKYYKKFGFVVTERAKKRRGDKEYYHIMEKRNKPKNI